MCQSVYQGNSLLSAVGGPHEAASPLPLLNHVVQHLHHGHRLLFGEPFLLQTLHEAERVEVVVPSPRRRGVERAPERRIADDAAQAPRRTAAGAATQESTLRRRIRTRARARRVERHPRRCLPSAFPSSCSRVPRMLEHHSGCPREIRCGGGGGKRPRPAQARQEKPRDGPRGAHRRCVMVFPWPIVSLSSRRAGGGSRVRRVWAGGV